MGIPLPDGTRLSAKVWMPVDALKSPLPAIVEYLPYRKSDGTAARDHGMHLHFAKAGYVCLRVDRRGCGDSNSLFDDEYSEQELQDGVDLLHWIAEQQWCNGRIGMQGISWGGFNAVQIAARAPEPLKAVISIGTTVDRYSDDIHYKGGIQLGENIGWAATVLSWFSTPPDPQIVGDAWRETWLERLNSAPFLAQTWMDHPDRDSYWQHGSICEDYAAIKAPVLVMGGQHDGYRNAMAHMAANLSSPVKAIFGPWDHKYPNISNIAPAIDYLAEALRWWDHWLKDTDTGVAHDPAMRAYIMDSVAPDPALNHRPGRWVSVAEWPSSAITETVFHFGDGTLGQAAPFSAQIETDLMCGVACGEYFPFGTGTRELPDDQTLDDNASTCFDSAPLSADMTLLGGPQVTLRVVSDQPRAQMIVRLCDLRPDGTSALISLGMLNLRHRDGFDEGRDLVVDQVYDIHVPLDQSAYRLPAGHRLRLAISNSYWPYCWPEAVPFTLTVTGGSLSLPELRGAVSNAEFDPPSPMEVRPYRVLRERHGSKTTDTDAGSRVQISVDHGLVEDVETGLITGSSILETWQILRDDPASAEVDILWCRSFGRAEWMVRTEVETHMRGHCDRFEFGHTLRAYEDDLLIFEREMRGSAPR
ncbi:CocE/NonD family hydrolase [Roseovarius pelagicus]|uniref:CocE/NonD family hydrolase n=1 Tax=Roseovarius pelagicus TaxID=2980108 RepID=A0ABY6D6X4_9RHOB|nr:CocE/NonD family hydrolase [Roseovarius pelagicus]UXX81892.1 CocE/NonD family hydrolase [Roseovarius pelagicus]